MERKELHIGPGAALLLLVGVVVSMCILGLLSMLHVRNEARLTQQSTSFVVSKYEASCQAERDFAVLDALVMQTSLENPGQDAALNTLDALLPANMTREGQVISWQIDVNENTTLICEAELCIQPSRPRLKWKTHAFVSTLGDETDEVLFLQ